MSSITELRNITQQLSDYFSKLSLNLVNTANALPSFEDYSDLLVYDALYADAVFGTTRAASFTVGALADTVHQVIAVNREFAMRAKGKAFYFVDAQTDSGNDASAYDDMYGRYLNYMRGTSPEQGNN